MRNARSWQPPAIASLPVCDRLPVKKSRTTLDPREQERVAEVASTLSGGVPG